MNDTVMSNVTNANSTQKVATPLILPSSNPFTPKHSGIDVPYKTALLFVSCICIMFLVLYAIGRLRGSRDEQAALAEQQQREREIQNAKMLLRERLIDYMRRKSLTTILTSSDIKTVDGSSYYFDIEDGGMVDGVARIETGMGIAEVGSIDADEMLSSEACENDVVMSQPSSPNTNVELVLDESQDDEEQKELKPSSNQENTKESDLEAGNLDIGNEFETCSELASPTKGNPSNLQKRKYRQTESMQSEVFLTRMGKPLSIPNVCAICLDCYKEGDTVVWSANVSCPHVFHRDCILDYVLQKKDQEAPCPCCRQVFLPKDPPQNNSDNKK